MISWDSTKHCDQARTYYYDCLDGHSQDDIPNSIQTHIEHCDHCKDEISRLSKALNHSSSDPQEQAHVALVNGLLEMHFDYAQTSVNCALTKTFLPSLAAQGIEITIPTPITVHIEQCPQCRHDWLELQSMHLSEVQLQRLTNCMDEKPLSSESFQEEHLTKEQVFVFSSVDYAEIDVTCLEHVCHCISCRERVLMSRKSLLGQVQAESKACEDISWEDLFDLGMPLGFNPLADEYVKYRKTTVEHVRQCKSCMKRIVALDHVLLNLLSPHESGVVTNYQLILDDSQQAVRQAYVEYPIQVDVHNYHQASQKVSCKTKLGQKRVHATRSGLGWMKIAAVLILLLGVTVFSILPKAGAGFWDRVYDSTTSAPVVHIKSLSSDSLSVTQECWFFPPNQAVMIKGNTRIDFDASLGLKKTVDLMTGQYTEIVLPSDLKNSLQMQIRGLFDLWPMEISQSATLTSEQHDGLDVYDVQWSIEKTALHWRAYVDHHTQRIQKVDRRYVNASGSRMSQSFEVDYPSLAEAQTFLRELTALAI